MCGSSCDASFSVRKNIAKCDIWSATQQTSKMSQIHIRSRAWHQFSRMAGTSSHHRSMRCKPTQPHRAHAACMCDNFFVVRALPICTTAQPKNKKKEAKNDCEKIVLILFLYILFVRHYQPRRLLLFCRFDGTNARFRIQQHMKSIGNWYLCTKFVLCLS